MDSIQKKIRNTDIAISKFGVVVTGDTKVAFILAITSKCKGGHYSFAWITTYYL